MGAHEHEDVERLAYRFWEERGRLMGSPEVDWYRAEREVETRDHDMPSLLDLTLEPRY